MKTAEEIRERLTAVQNVKEQFYLQPLESFSPTTIESLNAEIAALAWVLSKADVDKWREACETVAEGTIDGPRTLGEAIPILEAQAKHVAKQGVT